MVKLGKKLKENPPFFQDLKKIFIFQTFFQLFLSFILLTNQDDYSFTLVQYILTSIYFFIFLVAAFSYRYSLANKTIIMFFILEFFYLSINPVLLILFDFPFNLNSILLTFLTLTVTMHLFIHALSHSISRKFNQVLVSLAISLIIITLTFFKSDIFLDYNTLSEDQFWSTLRLINFNTYYIYLINISFLLFVWYIYNQEIFVLSEYLPSIMAVHTLMVANEVYQLYNFNHFIKNFIDALYFNFIINIGFTIVWLIRLYYISNPANKDNEKYILNYDLLKGFIDKRRDGVWISLLIKLGKKNIMVGSIILFLVICVPLIFIGEINVYNKLNILLMFIFCAAVIIYAIVFTQRKWFNHIGFLFKPKK